MQTSDPRISVRFWILLVLGVWAQFGCASKQPDLGPIIGAVEHVPKRPEAGADFSVTAEVKQSAVPIKSVELHVRIMFGETRTLPMSASGMNSYTAKLRLEEMKPGRMVRYFVTVRDQNGRTARYPAYLEGEKAPEFLGTITAGPETATRLQVLHWFVQDEGFPASGKKTRASVFFDGTLYDNVRIRVRGGPLSRTWPRKGLAFRFNPGHGFRLAPDLPRFRSFNLNHNYTDKSYIRRQLAWETYRDAGVPRPICRPLRVHKNGAFDGLGYFIERINKRFLERVGLDPQGAMYKARAEQLEKKTPPLEDRSDLTELVKALRGSAKTRQDYIFDHVDLPAVVNYLAATVLVHDNDHLAKNYYLFHDSHKTGEWTFLPWDKDLTFGRNYVGGKIGVLSDTIWADHDSQSHPLYGDSQHKKIDGKWNLFIDALYKTPPVRQMMLRRLRTLMDQLLQPPQTLPEKLHYEKRIDELTALLGPDAEADRAKWGNPWGRAQKFAQAVAILKKEYLAPRRVHLYVTHGPKRGGIIPKSQPESPKIVLKVEAQVTLENPNDFAVDLSGWRVRGSVTYTFRPGTVLPAGWTLHLVPDVAAFRRAGKKPGLFVQGNYRGKLTGSSPAVELVNDRGKPVVPLPVD